MIIKNVELETVCGITSKLPLFYEEVFRIAPVYVSNAEMMISKIMKGDGD